VLRHGFGQTLDAISVVHGHTQAAAACGQPGREPCHAVQFGHGDDLVGDGDVIHAACGQRLGL
jgi:hypothetical protein